MAIWKELTNPESFAGEYETAVAAPGTVERFARSNGTAPYGKKESLIGPGVVIEGKIQGDGDIRITGRVNGDVRISGSLFIEPAGSLPVL